MNKLLIIFFCFIPFFAFSQEQEIPKEAKSLYKGKAVRGFSLHADIASPIMGIASNKSIKTFEIQGDINLYNKFFPVLEIGYGEINTTLRYGQSYQSSAPFFRIGLNYNLLRNTDKEGKPRVVHSYPFIGLRYGFGGFNYKMDNIQMAVDYWGENKSYGFQNKSVYAGWLEIVGGIRVDVYKGFTMGWSVRLKTLFSSKDKAKIWWCPGQGFTSGVQFTFNYTVGYTFFKNTKQNLKKGDTPATTDKTQKPPVKK